MAVVVKNVMIQDGIHWRLLRKLLSFRIGFSGGCCEKCNVSGQGSVLAVVKTAMIQDRVQWRLL